VIGTGKIGRVFADICRGFGMKILAYDKFPAVDSGLDYVELDELFEKSDVISLHCPLTVETDHLIRSGSIRRMKDGVIIVNTSRGGLVNTEDLIQGLKSGKVGAACLDVYEEEGEVFYEDLSSHILQDDKLVRLIAMPNVIVTSHQAFLTKEALDNIAKTTVNNLVRFFAGDPDRNTEVAYQR
jgi:D-lactate dehydrogenase